MNGQQIKVGLADDDTLVRLGLATILESDPGIRVAAQADDGAAAVEMVRAHTLDVVLLDIRMPGLDGLAALRHIKGGQQPPAVAMLTTFGDDTYIEQAVRGGVDGFLLKSDSPADLIRSVHALSAGGAAFSPRVARWLLEIRAATSPTTPAALGTERLTHQQRRLLATLATGASNAEMARRHGLAEGTVKQYLREVFVTLGATNRVQAAIIAHQAGLTDPGGN